MAPGRLLLASNRLPVESYMDDEEVRLRHSAGGLARALGPVLRERGGVWIGWPGLPGALDLDALLAEHGFRFPFDLAGVPLSEREVKHFYRGFANEILWPLFHDLHPHCEFEPEHFEAYQDVQERFGEAILETARPGDLVWIHDYHLLGVARYLREQGLQNRTAFFLHIPFPSLDTFSRLPWREQVLESLLYYDQLGFQTHHDSRNFVECARSLIEGLAVEETGPTFRLDWKDRNIHVGHYPINIDGRDIEASAATERVGSIVATFDESVEPMVMLGIDRLDYTKGIPERLIGFEKALETHPELKGRLSLVQHLAPSRQDIHRYGDLKDAIERMVSRINGRFGTMTWTPVRYLYQYAEFEDILALYRIARIALVTPLRDGMNLVCKEYCAARTDEDGVLILSEFAGAAEAMDPDALLVNPHDVEAIADAIHHAFTMPADERRRRMHNLREGVFAYDVHAWARDFLAEVESRPLQETRTPGPAPEGPPQRHFFDEEKEPITTR